MLLAACPPDDGDAEATLDDVRAIEEAVLSFVRATLAAGHPVLVVADPALGALAAVVAGEYAVAARAEQEPVPPIVEILLARGEPDDEPPVVDGLPGAQRTYVSGDAGEIAAGRGAIAFMAVGHVSPKQLRSLMNARLAQGVLLQTIPSRTLVELDARALEEADIVAREADALAVLGDEPGPLPLPYLAQRFVARWSDGEDEPQPATRLRQR